MTTKTEFIFTSATNIMGLKLYLEVKKALSLQTSCS